MEVALRVVLASSKATTEFQNSECDALQSQRF
jgi:hypothetical protein